MALLRTTAASETAHGLHGRGVVLRAPTAFDYGAWADLRAESRGHLTPWEPAWASDELSRGAFRRRLRQYARDAAEDQGYALLLFRLRDDVLLGGLTLSHVRRGVAQAANLGYWIGVRHAGQGYMTEAVRTLLPFAFERLRLHRVEAACLAHNVASIHVLEKTGFKREGLARKYLKIDGVWQDHLLYAVTEDDSTTDRGPGDHSTGGRR